MSVWIIKRQSFDWWIGRTGNRSAAPYTLTRYRDDALRFDSLAESETFRVRLDFANCFESIELTEDASGAIDTRGSA